jgi:hypothetical protein
MYEVRSREKLAKIKKTKKTKYNGQQQREMNYDEPHLASNEET